MTEKPSLLVIEETPLLFNQLSLTFPQYEINAAATREEAITKLRRFEPAVIILNIQSSHCAEEALTTLKEILVISPETKIIMVAHQADRKIAMDAINMGAFDFYMKSLDSPEFNLIIERGFYLYSLEKERQHTKSLSLNHSIKGVITGSPLMQKVCHTVEKVAPNNISILLSGESGTGKEVLAKALHERSDRAQGPFIAINCAAIPETLLESELFGYEKGAFTGAVKQTEGKIELAHKGTLFLDEIGDLPLSLQPKLLRFLQERVIERLGGRRLIPVDVRVICATHRNLQQSIHSQLFREDLYYRLSEVTITIPPLRERIGDSVLMARAFLAKFAQEYKKPIKRFTDEALVGIHHYAWPGNVRELENKIKRAVIMSDGHQITLADLDLPFANRQPFPFNLKQVRDAAEKESILRAIHFCNGNLSKASALLGVTRPTLYNLMEKLSIQEVI